MHAAVLHTIGTVPRYEQFPEPDIVVKDAEVIVHVHAASLKPVDKQLASGSHYASRSELPRVCGSDGVGHLDDGQRVFFGGPRPPHGAMAQRTVVLRAFTFPISENVNDETAPADGRQSKLPIVLPHLEMLPKISLKNVTERLLMFCI